MNSPTLIRLSGDTHTMTLGDFLTQQQEAGLASIIELRGFNRTPPETLLPELHECLFRTPHPAACSWTDRRQALRHLPIRHPILFYSHSPPGKARFHYRLLLLTSYLCFWQRIYGRMNGHLSKILTSRLLVLPRTMADNLCGQPPARAPGLCAMGSTKSSATLFTS